VRRLRSFPSRFAHRCGNVVYQQFTVSSIRTVFLTDRLHHTATIRSFSFVVNPAYGITSQVSVANIPLPRRKESPCVRIDS
jgi:hypothetical protein